LICSCCGYEILDKPHSIEAGKKYVCDRCWNDPNLFFPEKIQDDARLKLLSKMADETRRQPNLTRLKVIRLYQKGIEMYIGKMKAKDILKLCEIDKFEEEELTGYQREIYKERTSDLVEYLAECSVAVMPGLFVSLREAKFVSQDADIGILEIPKKRGSIWIVDGQHRIGGFEKVRDRFVFDRKPDISPKLFSLLMDYELPVVFIDSRKAAEKVSNAHEGKNPVIKPEDLERAMFFVVNKTQKGINPSLKDALLYRIKIGGVDGIPILRKENWRIQAAFIGIMLSRDIDSPLRNRINISGKRDQGKPVQLNSFVSSLLALFRDKNFSNLSDMHKLRFVKAYWNVLGKMFPEAFDFKTSKDFMLLKAIGVYSLNWLAHDVFRKCIRDDLDCNDEVTLEKLLEPLRLFDWGTQTSPLSTLGGMKGVREAYRLLVMTLHFGTKEKTGSA